MTRAFVFPGQGAQVIGMGRDLAEAFPAARAVFEEVDAALGEALSALVWEGDAAELTLTRNAQPALMATSLAAMRALEAEGVAVTSAAFVAGHSLGEYSALCAAGSLSLADTARLLRLRGQAMQEAVPVGQGAMAALLGLDLAAAEAVAAEAAQGAGLRGGQRQRSGARWWSRATARRSSGRSRSPRRRGAKRALLLPVSAPFHCALMQPAAEAMAAALAEVAIAAPAVPLVANVKAAAVSDPEEIRRLLVAQVTGRVRWRESVLWMAGAGRDRDRRGRRRQGAVRDGPPDRQGNRDEDRGHAGRGPGARRPAEEGAMFDLTGKTALVTGASGGIGGAIARALHGAGRDGRRSRARAPRRSRRWPASSASARTCCPATSRTPAAVEALPKAAAEAMGAVDILVNNAGITRDQLFMRMSDADWDAVLAVNLTSVMRLSRGVLRGMMKARWGRIVNVSSIVGVTGNPGQANYAASKAGGDRHVEEPGAGGGEPGDHGQLRGAGLHRHGDDRRRSTTSRRRGSTRRSRPGGWGAPRRSRRRRSISPRPEAAYVTGQTLHVNGGMAMI